MIRAGKCQGIQDRVTKIALDCADAEEQALCSGTCDALCFGGGEGHILYGCLDPGGNVNRKYTGIPR